MSHSRKRRWPGIPRRRHGSQANERMRALAQMAEALEPVPYWPALMEALEGPVRRALGAAAIELVPGRTLAGREGIGRTLGVRGCGEGTDTHKPAGFDVLALQATDPDVVGALIIDFPVDRTLARRDARFIKAVGALLGLALEGNLHSEERPLKWGGEWCAWPRRRIRRRRSQVSRRRRLRAHEPSPAA